MNHVEQGEVGGKKARPGDEVSMWRQHDDPMSYDGTQAEEDAFATSEWHPGGVEAAIDAYRDAEICEKPWLLRPQPV